MSGKHPPINNKTSQSMDDDEGSKVRVNRMAPEGAAKPGAMAVAGEQAAALDRRIAEKRAGASTMKQAPESLVRLEQDLDMKQKGRSNAVAVQPGVVAVGATPKTPPSDLTRLEADLQAKQLNRSTQASPGSIIPTNLTGFETDVAAKRSAARPISNSENPLSQLEADVLSKNRARPGAVKAAAVIDQKVAAKVGGGSSVLGVLKNMEDAVQSKVRTSHDVSTVSHIDSSATNQHTFTPRTLRDIEETILAKQQGTMGSGLLEVTEESVMAKKDVHMNSKGLDQQEQYINHNNVGKESGLDSEMGEGLYSGIHNNTLQANSTDLEYGVFGGPEEKGLAIAFAVEEEDEDMFIPSAVEYDPDAKPPMYRNRRFRLYALLAIAVVIVVTIGAATGISLSQQGDVPQLHYRETIGIRENIERLVGREVLDDRTSPYRRALDWITFDDKLQLTTNDASFVQRYFAAYFYFATSVKKDWDGGCAPAKEDEESSCLLNTIINTDPIEYKEIPWIRWLSNTAECSWAGVGCDDLAQIRSIELTGANMTGSFPEGISGFPFLQSISFAYSSLEGKLPDFVADLKHLVNLELQGNAFTGTVPGSWYSSRSLQRINLSLNQLTGSISSSISQLRDAKGIFFIGNMLTGSIPTEIGAMSSLTFFRVNNNLLSGTIPTELGNLRDISDLWLQKNKLQGPMPSELGILTLLEDIRVHGNSLSGSIPEEFYNLSMLFRFDGYDNQLTGTISTNIRYLTNLDALRIENNKISGELPTELGMLSNASFMRLSGNDLVGSVPEAVCQLRSGVLQQLETDCATVLNGVPEVECSCCTLCCNAYGSNCYPVITDGN